MRVTQSFVTRRELVTFLLAIVSSIFIILSNEGEQIQTIRSWTFAGFGFMLERFAVLTRYQEVFEENQWLREQNARLVLANGALAESKFENQRLRDLLGFKAKSELQLVPAKLIGKQENGFINSIFLDAGSRDGLKKNMAVVTAQGLVGKIFRIGEQNATAQLLLDRNFRVSAMVQRSRVTGVVRWLGSNQVVLAEVPKRSDIRIGDKVVTSGLSTIFPGGLDIGVITQTDESRPGMLMDVLLYPTVDFSKLEEVFVVRMAPAPVTIN